jgi:4-amino-4-deoxychorismate lyase
MIEALVDGKPDDRVAVDDRGLLYGDHLFETIAFVGGRAPLWRFHMARLVRDARRLLMPEPDIDRLASECARLVAERPRAVVRVTLTRGSGGRAYEPPADPSPRRILLCRPWPSGLSADRTRGIVLHTSPIRLSIGPELAGIKHGNRLEQVLAAEHARRAGVDEAALFDVRGRLVEAIAGNLIVIVDGRAVTPGLDEAGVAGVGLQWLSERVEGDLVTGELDSDKLRRAEGVMVINSIAGIRPVRRLDDRPLAIAHACRRWQQLWNELFECED